MTRPLGLALKGSYIVDTGWANSHPGCKNWLKKHYSHLVEGAFLARKAVWVLNKVGNAVYCMLINEWAVTSLPIAAESALGLSQGSDRNENLVG